VRPPGGGRTPGAGWAEGCAGLSGSGRVRVPGRFWEGCEPDRGGVVPDPATGVGGGGGGEGFECVCLACCLKKVTACLEICKALPSSKD
jgi:hypothetical protein